VPGDTYFFTVVATNQFGDSSPAYSNDVTIPSPQACPTCAFGSRQLDRGDSGSDVKELQIRVLGWVNNGTRAARILPLDGNFSGFVEQAVHNFQAAYGLTADGIVGSQTFAQLNALADSDGTISFSYSEFASRNGDGFTGGMVNQATASENVRRVMYRLEALRRKLGNQPVTINSGFRSIKHNKSIPGAADSQHMYGTAADNKIGPTTYNRAARDVARQTAFSAIFCYDSNPKPRTHNHYDIRSNNDHDQWRNERTADPPRDTQDRDHDGPGGVCLGEPGASELSLLPEDNLEDGDTEGGPRDPNDLDLSEPIAL
jgi:peptidoglycan hydrolase-like protein with peptidoglycan-binding domain